MYIPYENISPDTLRRLIESYVLREGTDYGQLTYTLEEKVDQVYAQLKAKKAVIFYSPLHKSIDILEKG